MESELYKTILQSGVLGAVLVWALWQNQKLVQKVISVCEETNKVLTALAHEIREASRS